MFLPAIRLMVLKSLHFPTYIFVHVFGKSFIRIAYMVYKGMHVLLHILFFAAHLRMASSTEDKMKALLKVLVDCAEDATKSLGGLVDHALDHMHDEEIIARTLFAIKERLELLQQDALEAKVQAFPEIAKYARGMTSVLNLPLRRPLQQLLIHLLMKRSSTALMSVMSGTSAILIGQLVIATGILISSMYSSSSWRISF